MLKFNYRTWPIPRNWNEGNLKRQYDIIEDDTQKGWKGTSAKRDCSVATSASQEIFKLNV